MDSIRRYAPHAGRIVMGLVFTFFGLNGLFQFVPMPAHPGAAGAFLGALAATGYMFPLIKITETAAGLLLLSNRFVPLALTLLAPVIVNILAFHAALDPAGLPLIALIVVGELALAWAYRDAFKPMLRAKTSPKAPEPRRTAARATA